MKLIILPFCVASVYMLYGEVATYRDHFSVVCPSKLFGFRGYIPVLRWVICYPKNLTASKRTYLWVRSQANGTFALPIMIKLSWKYLPLIKTNLLSRYRLLYMYKLCTNIYYMTKNVYDWQFNFNTELSRI
jgi:hypothetical protein